VFSDLHLGHDRNPTLSIIENFRAFLKDHDKVLRDLDIIFIAGDIFDKLIKKNTSESMLIDNWFIELVLYCELRNIKIRILEGTQSHDYKQSANIANIIQQLKSNVDFKYISTLHIEQMEDLGLKYSTVLIPMSL
jgi:UDP-2,3-diacylglucosamine pyrophosphatase LpxH